MRADLDSLKGRQLQGLHDTAAAAGRMAQQMGDSALAMAQSALSDFQTDAMTETMEDMSLALGGRLRESATGSGPKQANAARPRVLTQKLVAELATVDAVALDNVLDGEHAWQHASDPMQALARQYPDAGQRALLMAALLAHGKPGARLRRQLEEGLGALSLDEDLSLSLFGALEFGVSTPALRQELKRLYHRASLAHQKMSHWLAALGQRDERRRKLRAMLRVLAYELSASGEPIVGHHLAAVIGDLQQLLRIIGLEAHCDQAAAALRLPTLDGEVLLHSVVTLIEQVWLNADQVAEALPPLAPQHTYRVAQTLGRLVQLLPEHCFSDADQKQQIASAVAELRDRSVGDADAS